MVTISQRCYQEKNLLGNRVGKWPTGRHILRCTQDVLEKVPQPRHSHCPHTARTVATRRPCTRQAFTALPHTATVLRPAAKAAPSPAWLQVSSQACQPYSVTYLQTYHLKWGMLCRLPCPPPAVPEVPCGSLPSTPGPGPALPCPLAFIDRGRSLEKGHA